jgi:uncharacterized membrane protein required for colicin V production
MVLDIIIVIIALLYMGLGFWRGLLRSVLSLVKISVSIILAILLGRPIAGLLDKWFSISEGVGEFTWIAICVLCVFILLRLVLRLLDKVVRSAHEKSDGVKKVDRILGLIFGFVRFAMLCFVISLVIFVAEAIGLNLVEPMFKNSPVCEWIYRTCVKLLINPAISALGGAIAGGAGG